MTRLVLALLVALGLSGCACFKRQTPVVLNPIPQDSPLRLDCPRPQRLVSSEETALPEWVSGLMTSLDCEREKRAGVLRVLDSAQ